MCVCSPTISDEGSAREHLPKHELDDSQDDTHQTTNDGHTEEEVILRGNTYTQIITCLLVGDI